MPLKARVSKRRAWTITDAVLDAYQTAQATEGTYIRCIRNEGCTAPSLRRHCETCRDYLEARRTLHRLLGLQPWRPCVTDIAAADEDPEVFEMREAIEARLAERD